MSDFAKGFFPKPKHDNAPEFVIGKLNIRREDAIAWLQSQTGEWVRLDMKVSKSGKGYAEVDTWEPSGQQSRPAPTDAEAFDDDLSVPF